MPLTNFGAILNFAEKIEKGDRDFYQAAAQSPAAVSHQELFDAFAREGKKCVSLVQRTRRENVTEMILEPIRDFVRDSYQTTAKYEEGSDLPAIMETAISLENRAIRYYTDAAEKIRALPEVSRALKTLAKKRNKRLGQLQASS